MNPDKCLNCFVLIICTNTNTLHPSPNTNTNIIPYIRNKHKYRIRKITHWIPHQIQIQICIQIQTFTNTNTKIHKHKYKNSQTQIQIRKELTLDPSPDAEPSPPHFQAATAAFSHYYKNHDTILKIYNSHNRHFNHLCSLIVLTTDTLVVLHSRANFP